MHEVARRPTIVTGLVPASASMPSATSLFAHLADPLTYPNWLVGAQRIRSVDDDWPRPGSQFHHRVGVGPLTLDDDTTVVSVSTPDELVLRASLGPLGTALIRFTLEGSTPTTVYFDEAPDSGLLKLIGRTIGRWALKPTAWGRNEASLRRLSELLCGTDPKNG